MVMCVCIYMYKCKSVCLYIYCSLFRLNKVCYYKKNRTGKLNANNLIVAVVSNTVHWI